MTWEPDFIDWLKLNSLLEFERAITDFLNSNPVLNGRQVRPTMHRDLRSLFNAASEQAKTVLELALNNHRNRTSRVIQEKMVTDVTKYLILQHYEFKRDFGRPRPQHSTMAEGQVWFPASYYLVRKNTLFDWELGNPQRDFYGSLGRGTRHPVVVTSERQDGLYVIVPLTHSPGDTKVDLGNGKWRFAKHSFPCIASWAMLEGDGDARSLARLRVTSIDLTRIKKKISERLALE